MNGLEHVIVVGGAIQGCFAAWSLRERGFVGKITVIEKDPTYQFSSTALSAACIRTQFTTSINIELSLFGADLFRNLTKHFGPDANIGFREKGYLILGGAGSSAGRKAAVDQQNALGAEIITLDRDGLKAKFPFLNVDDVEIGSFGVRNEGWFDAWSLLSLVRNGAKARAVDFLRGNVTGFELQGDRIVSVVLEDGSKIDCDWCVLAAGPASGKLMQRIGVDLPITPRKRTAFAFKTPLRHPDFPMLFDNSGIWVRPEGETFIGGILPPEDIDGDATGDFEPHHHLLEDFWPLLAHRIPAMEQLRLERAWAGHYEVNDLDHNGVLGCHDRIGNLVFSTGFSGHGVMHAPGAGRAVAELIMTGKFQTLDASPLGYSRIRDKRPMQEGVVY